MGNLVLPLISLSSLRETREDLQEGITTLMAIRHNYMGRAGLIDQALLDSRPEPQVQRQDSGSFDRSSQGAPAPAGLGMCLLAERERSPKRFRRSVSAV